MVSFLSRGSLGKLLTKTQCRINAKVTKSVSYVAERLSEDYGKRLHNLAMHFIIVLLLIINTLYHNIISMTL